MIVKVIRKQDAYFKLKPAKSGETSLNISNDNATYLGGESGNVTFRIYRVDFMLAFANIIRLLPLYVSTSKSYEQVTLEARFCDKLYNEFNTFFDGNETALYTVNMLIRDDGRNYLNNLKVGNFSIRHYLVELHNKLEIVQGDDLVYDLRLRSQFGEYDLSDDSMLDFEDSEEDNIQEIDLEKYPFQQIYYGAPGTGKSYDIDRITKSFSVVRTTFHPDSDYSTFVGAYKPTMENMPVYGGQGVKITEEKRITYTFVKQAFLKAYLGAWKKYAGVEVTPQFLVIEEINRGNCAQIFGDLFQLLDRNDNGFSSYPIEADTDLQKEIKKAFEEEDEYKLVGSLQVDDVIKGYTSNHRQSSLSKDIKEGRVLLLPNNLYIWATMNTSDQSLFPIDSAFKRRWDWKYVRITNGYERGKSGKRKLDENSKPIPLGWQIEANGEKYDWWNFVQAINEKIAAATESDDKKLGYFFCRAKDGIIDAETFVGKVIFYLWNDVFKDEDSDIFKLVDGEQATFDQFYKEDEASGEVVANEEMASVFLKKLGLVQVDEDFADSVSQKSDWVVYVNGAEIKKANQVPYTVIEKYVELHPEMTAQNVIDIWEPFKKYTIRRWIVANKEEIDSMEERYANYSYPIKCKDGSFLWVNKDGWMHHPTNPDRRDTVAEFIKAVKEANLGITITEESI